MARDVKLYYKLEEHVKEEFQKLAEDMGTTMSGLTAHLVGQYVYTQRTMMERLSGVVGDMLGKELDDIRREREEMYDKVDRILGYLENRKTVSGADLDTEK